MIPPHPSHRAELLGSYAPLPMVGAAAILVALIVFTPVLVETGPTPLARQAELIVYRVVGGLGTDFYLHAVGSDVPYAHVSLALGTGFGWTGACPTSGISWNNTSASDRLELDATGTASPMLVYATANYTGSGSTTIYAGELAFEVVNPGSPAESLNIVPCTTATPGVTAPTSYAVSQLPLSLLLVDYGSGGPP